MKNLRLSKTSWLILSAGVFIVILVGLGLTRSQQIQEESQLNEELSVTENRLDNLEVTNLQRQQEELQQRLEETMMELEDANYWLQYPIKSVDVDDKIFSIAEYSNVEIMNISTTTISNANLGGIGVLSISVMTSVRGETADIINFVINLNSGLPTGIVQTVGISIPEENEESEDLPSGTFSLVIYSCEDA
jgi:hypothetical protein